MKLNKETIEAFETLLSEEFRVINPNGDELFQTTNGYCISDRNRDNFDFEELEEALKKFIA